MVVLIRHTTPDIAAGTCYGQLDVPVAHSFQDEAGQVAARIPSIDLLVASPLSRCQALAGFLSNALNIPMREDARLMEMNFGSWEGKRWDDIAREELDAWANDFWHAKPHGGEAVADLKARTDEALKDIGQSHSRVAVITHAGVIKAAFAKDTTAHSYNRAISFGEVTRWPS